MGPFFMAYDWLKDIEDHYDVVVIGSGLGGLTGANVLAKCGHKVLLVQPKRNHALGQPCRRG